MMTFSSDDNTDTEVLNEEVHERKNNAKTNLQNSQKVGTRSDEGMNKFLKCGDGGNVTEIYAEVEDNIESKGKHLESLKVESKRTFYNTMEENCDVIIPERVRANFPMSIHVPTIIRMLENIKLEPNCIQRRNLVKKWCVLDGNLCSARKKGNEFRCVTAYEDIFDLIYNVDASKNFTKSIVGLTNDVQERSNNISEKMVQLYSRICHKRDHKQRGASLKKVRKSKDDETNKRKIDDFIRKLRNCTALGHFDKLREAQSLNISAKHLVHPDDEDKYVRLTSAVANDEEKELLRVYSISEKELCRVYSVSDIHELDKKKAFRSTDEVIEIMGDELEVLNHIVEEKDILIRQLREDLKEKESSIQKYKGILSGRI